MVDGRRECLRGMICNVYFAAAISMTCMTLHISFLIIPPTISFEVFCIQQKISSVDFRERCCLLDLSDWRTYHLDGHFVLSFQKETTEFIGIAGFRGDPRFEGSPNMDWRDKKQEKHRESCEGYYLDLSLCESTWHSEEVGDVSPWNLIRPAKTVRRRLAPPSCLAHRAASGVSGNNEISNSADPRSVRPQAVPAAPVNQLEKKGWRGWWVVFWAATARDGVTSGIGFASICDIPLRENVW